MRRIYVTDTPADTAVETEFETDMLADTAVETEFETDMLADTDVETQLRRILRHLLSAGFDKNK